MMEQLLNRYTNFIAMLFLILFVACDQDKFTLTGTIKDNGKTLIYLAVSVQERNPRFASKADNILPMTLTVGEYSLTVNYADYQHNY